MPAAADRGEAVNATNRAFPSVNCRQPHGVRVAARHAEMLIVPAALRAIDGIENQTGHEPADPRFTEVVAALARIEAAGTTGMRLSRGEGGDAVVMVIGGPQGPRDHADAAKLRETLGLAPDLQELGITFGALPRSSGEVATLTRSLIEIMLEVALGIDVPARRVEATRVLAGGPPLGTAPDLAPRPRTSFARGGRWSAADRPARDALA